MLPTGYNPDSGKSILETTGSQEIPAIRTYLMRWEYNPSRSTGELTLKPNFSQPGLNPQLKGWFRWRPVLPAIESANGWKQLDPDDIRLHPVPFGLLVQTVINRGNELPMMTDKDYTVIGYRVSRKSKLRISLLLISSKDGDERVLTVEWRSRAKPKM